MVEAGESHPEEEAAHPSGSPPEVIEQDLDTVDKALAALDAGDLAAAEALAAELDSPGAGSSDGDASGGGEQEPASGSA